MSFDHEIEDFNQLLIPKHILVLETVILKQRFDGNIRVDLGGRFVGYPKQEEEYIFEVDNGDDHP